METRDELLPILLAALVLAAGVSGCRKPNPVAKPTQDAGAIAPPVASDQGEGQAACQRMAQVRDDCGTDKPCPPSRLDDFQKCAAYLRQAGLAKNPY